jgi:hypothetical protein
MMAGRATTMTGVCVTCAFWDEHVNMGPAFLELVDWEKAGVMIPILFTLYAGRKKDDVNGVSVLENVQLRLVSSVALWMVLWHFVLMGSHSTIVENRMGDETHDTLSTYL